MPAAGQPRPTRTAAARWLAPLAVLGLVLAGCGGSSGQSVTPTGSPSGSAPSSSGPSSGPSGNAGPSAPAFASTSAGTPSDRVLSKPDFLISMNAVCSAVDAQLQALPTPTGATDFDAIHTNLTGTLRVVPFLISRAEALVARTAQRAELQKNWIDLKRADFLEYKPVAEQMVRHSIARDAAKLQADAAALSALPTHRDYVKSYLDEYGLTSCGHLETY